MIDNILIASAAFCLTLIVWPLLRGWVHEWFITGIVKRETANFDTEIRDVLG